MSAAISVQNISKRFRIRTTDRTSAYRTLREDLTRLAKAPLRMFGRGSRSQRQEFWALRDISFEVQPGEVVGIIGRNGAGKSTLLKILSRITKPTGGYVRLRGRVASLLEVGTGFHPELNGRENIFLSGSILGMKRHEIRRRFDDIVAFAEVEQFLETPVKHYSSGMYVRLGFAVAAHLEPEILIIDEVLAVGDMAFQRKCLGRINEVASDGRAVLFVSHNMVAIRALCGRAIVLDRGSIACAGTPDDAVRLYQAAWKTDERGSVEWSLAQAPGSDDARLVKVDVKPFQGECLDVESGVRISVEWLNSLVDANLDCTVRVVNSEDIVVFQSGTVVTGDHNSFRGLYRASVIVSPHLLNFGIYRLSVVIGRERTYVLAAVDDVAVFEIHNTSQGGKLTPSPGVVRPDLKWNSTFLGASGQSGNGGAEASG